MRYYLLGTICVAAAVGISYDYHSFTVEGWADKVDELHRSVESVKADNSDLEEERQNLLNNLFNASVARSELGMKLSVAEGELEAQAAISGELANQLAIANQTIDGLIPQPIVNPDPMDATMKLLIEGGGHGSATHIGNGYAITAGHVAEKEGDKLIARFQNGNKVKAVTLWSNKKYDVALIKLEGYTGPASNLDCRTPDMSESIGLYGNPLAMEFVKTNGVVASGITGSYSQAWAEALPIDGAMAGGMSGGGAFDSDGDLVGINVGVPVQSMGYSGTFTGISFIVPASTICGLLAR